VPTSDFHQISDVLHVVHQAQPATVLDIGVGFGKWGMLCREVLEIYNERVPAASWTTRIDGIEIHEPYRNPLWSLAYNAVHIGDASQVLPTLGTYDLILCCDVIEHFERAEGMEFLNVMLAHGSLVILTSPRGFVTQSARYGNEHEVHRSGWTESDFATFPHLYKDIGFTFMAVLSRFPDRLTRVDMLHPLQVLGVKRGAASLLQLAIRHANRRIWRTSH
jgi:hypothetical protein